MLRKLLQGLELPLLQRVLVYSRPYRRVFNIATALTIILAFMGPARPILIQLTIDQYIRTSDAIGLNYMIAALVGILIIEAILQYFQSYMTNFLGQSVIRDIRVKIFRHILNFKFKYFDRTPIGTLVTRAISDVETIAEMFSSGLLSVIGDLLKLIVVVITMFLIDWRLALYSLVPIPILIMATRVFKAAIKTAYQEVRTQVANLNSFVQEHINGMNIVQIFNKEDQELEKFIGLNKKHRNAHIKTVWAYSVFFPVVEILSATSLALLVWWGTNGAMAGYITPGDLVAFILFIYMLYRPIRQLADRFNTLQMGLVSAERIFKILDTDATIEDKGQLKLEGIKGDIDIENLSFAYKDEDWVLKNLSLKIRSGEMIAIVGATGSGKSSLINLLGRYYEFQKGSISVDGNDLREIELHSLRNQMAVVLQDVMLFSDTILNNITLYDENIDIEEVEEAAKKVGAHSFIEKLPGGYQYNVRERGSMLSVGQRQLISFIRAYVSKPDLLILDEATSSIDSGSEQLIQYATEVLTKNRTSIVIAHRLSTIRNADRIVLMEKGEIIEIGTHAELMAQNGHYKKYYDLQYARESNMS